MAKNINVSRYTLSDALTVATEGTATEISECEHNDKSVNTIASDIRIRRPGRPKLARPRPQPKLKPGPKNSTIAKRFDRSLSLLCNNCEYLAEEIVIPQMTSEESKGAINRLKDARRALQRLIDRIKEESNHAHQPRTV